MSNVSVKALKSFTVRNSSTGALTSYTIGEVYSIDSSLASAWASDGLVDNNAGYLIPTGKKNITAMTEQDVAAYASAQVVDANLVADKIKKDVTILGVTGSYAAPTPTGKKEITSTAETDVAGYATAQVVDANLVAGNIKKDVTILGVTGSLE